MNEDKIKAELLKKIAMLKKVEEELEKKDEELKKIYGDDLDYEEIEKTDKELYNLFDRHISLLDKEIPELLIQTKFYPLCGLAPYYLESLIGTGEPQLLTNVVKRDEKTKQWISAKDVFVHEDVVEKYLEFELDKNREDMKRRIGLLKSLNVSYELDSWTKYLYRQVAQCFTYGFFESCCILPRAIAESIAEEYIKLKGHSDLLRGKDKRQNTFSVAWILKNKLKIDQKTIDLYVKISKAANNVLHKRETRISEEESLSSIAALHLFIKTFPKP